MPSKKVKTKASDKESAQNPILEHGRIPPNAIQIEPFVLGALLIDPQAINAVIDFLHPDVFYKENHRIIYKCIQDLFSKSMPIDILTVAEELKKQDLFEEAGGSAYLIQLSNSVVSSANIEYHARILVEKYLKRKLIEISTEIINEAHEESIDVFDLLDTAENKLFQINEENLKRKGGAITYILSDVKENIHHAAKSNTTVTGVPSGFKSLDQYTSGWQPSDLIIIAARPGMGKTAFVLTMARKMTVEYKIPTAFFSLEMSSHQLVMRLLSSETRIPTDVLRRGQLSQQQWKMLNRSIETLSSAPFFIDDTPSLSIFELRAKARRFKQQHDIQCIIIDYLQLMSAKVDKNATREIEIATISRSLKALAKELNIPVIALSQLSREVEKRAGTKRPQLSDLRESGSIEQDADLVLFIYRPEYYYKEGSGKQAIPEEQKNYAEIIIEKHRNGPQGTVKLKFIPNFATFYDETDHDYQLAINYLKELEPETTYTTDSIIVESRMNKEVDEYLYSGTENEDEPF
ncbi:MAG: replicative DNA helicase [Bacteroidales bacterium]|nr:replicative DNA helicase [Bacteroidales bacterium]